MDNRTVRAAAVSPPVVLGDVEHNLQRIRAAIAEAVASGARLIVAPELSTSGYVFTDRAEAARAALDPADPRWGHLRTALRHDTVAVVGYAEAACGGEVFNSALVLERDRVVGSYRKSHLWGREKLVFRAGNAAGALFDTVIGRLAVAICYDNEFPEVPRRLALAGAHVLALPVNWPLVDRPPGEHPPEVIQAMAAARSSRLPIVIADRHGTERGVEWTGGSGIVDHEGWFTPATMSGDSMQVLRDLPLGSVADKSLPPHNDLFEDRRPALY